LARREVVRADEVEREGDAEQRRQRVHALGHRLLVCVHQHLAALRLLTVEFAYLGARELLAQPGRAVGAAQLDEHELLALGLAAQRLEEP
jgi:hypothetical protein